MTNDKPGRRRGSRRILPWVGPAVVCCVLSLWSCPAAAQVTSNPLRVRHVYIPFDQLEVLFDGPSKGMLLSREKVLALLRDAQSQTPSDGNLPADSAVTQATYEARLEDQQLRVTGRIQIVKLTDKWEVVDLPFGGLAIESARLEQEPALLGRRDDGGVFLMLEKQGRVALELEIAVPLAGTGGDLAATVTLPSIPASEMVIRLDENKQLQVGDTTLPAANIDAGQHVFRVAVDPTGIVPLVISDRFSGGTRAPLILAHSRSIAQVEPGGMQWTVQLDLDVHARATETIELQLPDCADIAEIESPQLAQWTAREAADGTQAVTLSFRQPFLGRRVVRLHALSSLPPSTAWDYPTLKVRQATSHVGTVQVAGAPSLRVELDAIAGIRPERVAPDECSIEGNEAGHLPLGWAFWEEDFRLGMRVTPRQRTLQASVATLVEARHTGLALRGSVTVQPRHVPVFELQLSLPCHWIVTSVRAGSEPVEWDLAVPATTDLIEESPLQTVRIDLGEPLHPDQSLEVELTAECHPEGWLAEGGGGMELPLPELRLEGADEVEGTLLVRAPSDIELTMVNVSNDLEAVSAVDIQRASSAEHGTVLQYRYQDDTRVHGRLRASARPAKVSSRTLAFARLDHGRLDVHYQLDFRIEHGTMRVVRFSLPAATGEGIQVVPVHSAARIIEQRCILFSSDGRTDEQLNVWHIVLDRPVSGDLTLAVDLAQAFPSPETDEGWADLSNDESGEARLAAPVTVPMLALHGVTRQSGTIALEAAGDQRMHYEGEHLRDVDPADVRHPIAYVPRQRIVAAYQYERLPYRLTVSATRHVSDSVLTAICEAAEIVSVAGRSGRTHHQARFRLRSRSLQHVPVTLPQEATLWAVLLDREPVEVRRNQGAYLIPLLAGAEDSHDDARELTVLYETEDVLTDQRNPWQRWRSRSIQHHAPELGVTTLSTTWHVHLPSDVDVISSGGDFTPTVRLTRPVWASWLAEAIADRGTTGLPWKFGGLVAAFALAGLFALVSSGRGVAASVTQLLVILFVLGVIIALMLPATQSAREAARRMSCSNNLKQIGLAMHNYHDVYGRFPPASIGPDNVPRDRQFSWIVALLPFLEQQTLYERLRLDLPWDHPLNAAVLQDPVPTLFCPSDPTTSTTQDGFPRTSYVAITGSDMTTGVGGLRGVIGLDQGLSLQQIVDGTSSTLMVAEVTDGGPWFAGGAGTARRIDDWIGNKVWSHHPSGANVLLADGSVRFLSVHTDVQTLRHLATAQGSDPIDDEDFGGGHARASRSAAIALDKEVVPREEADVSADSAPPVAGPQTLLEAESPLGLARRDDRARRSLRVMFEPLSDEAVLFRRDGGSGELVLGVQDRAFARALQACVCAAILLIAWLCRRTSGRRRALAAVAGLAVSLGGAGLVPLTWTPLLDGLLLGTLAAAGLWLLPSAAVVVARGVVPSGAVTCTVLAAAVLLGGKCDECMSQETLASTLEDRPTDGDRPHDLTLYIPYQPGQDNPFNNQLVYLPHAEFLRLWQSAYPETAGSRPSGTGPIVSHAEYSGRLEDNLARFDGRLVIHHPGGTWGQVAIPLGDVALERVEIDGRPAAMVEDQQAIYLEKPGLYVVDIRFSVPASRLGATGRLTVPLREVAAGRLLFQLPDAGLDVQVSGSTGGWRRQARVDQETQDPARQASDAEGLGDVITIPLGDAGELSIRWQPRGAAAPSERLNSVEQSLLVELLDSGVHLESAFEYRVQQGTLRELQFHIPPRLSVQHVHGADVADWSIEGNAVGAAPPDAQRLVVLLKSERAVGTQVRIRYLPSARQPDGVLAIQSLEPIGVQRESGRVAVAVADSLRVRVDKVDSLERINHLDLELPRDLRDECVPLAAYRYNARPWQLQLAVERKRAQVEVVDRTAVHVAARQVAMRSMLTADVTNSPIAALELRLPASLRVSQVHVPHGADWFLDRDEKGRRLKVRLSEPAIGRLELVVSGSLPRDAETAEWVLPGIAMDDVAAHRGQVAITLDEDLEAVLVRDSGALPVDPMSLDSSLRAREHQQIRYAFRYETPPTDLTLRLSGAPSRLSGDVTTVVSVREGAVAYLSQVDFEIRQAGCSRFRVATPLWLGDDLGLRGEHVRQIRSHVTETDRVWEIELQQAMRHAYRVYLTQTLPAPNDGTVPAAIIRPLDVEQSRHHVVLENRTADEVVATTIRGATPIAHSAIPASVTETLRRQAVAAYRVSGDSAELVWQRQVRELETGLTASISLADLTTVVHADGRYRARVSYHIRNFTLQFLEVELPPASQIWSVHISGQPVRPAKVLRAGRTITLLPLQKASAGDFSSKVVVVYAGDLGAPLGYWSRLSPPPPRILSDVPVSRTLWTLLLPREYHVGVVRRESNLEEVEAARHLADRKLSFLDELRQMVRVASVKSGSGAGAKARDNLKQVGSALHSYSQTSAPIDGAPTMDVREQAEQIEAEIRRLGELLVERAGDDGETARYFEQPWAHPPADQVTTDGDSDAGVGEPQSTAAERVEQSRDRLRERAAEQLDRLQTGPAEALGQRAPIETPRAADDLVESDAEPAGDPISGDREQTAARSPTEKEATASMAGAARTGVLPLDLDLTLTGTAYHFRKLHGEPRLNVRVRHESLNRYLSAVVWAVACLALAAAALSGLSRAPSPTRAARVWPWLVALAGTSWMFLLPAGVCGFLLLVVALCVLVVRWRKTPGMPRARVA